MQFYHISAKIIIVNTFNFLKSPQDVSSGVVQRVKARRKEKKLTQRMLSERSAVSLGSVKRFERTGEISLSSLIRIAFVLECEDDFDELFKKRGYASIQEVIDEPF